MKQSFIFFIHCLHSLLKCRWVKNDGSILFIFRPAALYSVGCSLLLWWTQMLPRISPATFSLYWEILHGHLLFSTGKLRVRLLVLMNVCVPSDSVENQSTRSARNSKTYFLPWQSRHLSVSYGFPTFSFSVYQKETREITNQVGCRFDYCSFQLHSTRVQLFFLSSQFATDR